LSSDFSGLLNPLKHGINQERRDECGLVIVLTLAKGANDGAVIIVYKASAIMLLVMGTWSSQTRARTSIVTMKICPNVKSGVALLFVVGSLI
jgi:hypothetical protein